MVVLIAAGLDPSGGAGMVADVATVARRGLRAAAVVTAQTVQDSARCHEAIAGDPELVAGQIARVVVDLPIAAVKIGMLGDEKVARAVAAGLSPLAARGVPIVLDPVLRATAGSALLDGDPRSALEALLAIASLVTPNREEAARLSGIPVDDEKGQIAAAQQLREQGVHAVLVKGGHFAGDSVADLFLDGGDPLWLRSPRIPGEAPHGTGCALSTEIACALAAGNDLRESVALAHARVVERIAAAVSVGKGRKFL
jgi:hydroxymethylpyrimidine/phosphomethylpyrimidine kinase